MATIKLFGGFFVHRNPRILISLALSMLFSGCLATSFDTSLYANQTDRELMLEIAFNFLRPTSDSIYAQDALVFERDEIYWRDVSNFNVNCQSRLMKASASRQDLEVIYFVWVQNAGNENAAADEIKKSLGNDTWRSAVEIYGGGADECIRETFRYVKELKNS